VRRRSVIGQLLTYVFLSAIGCSMLTPFLWMCSTALKPDEQMERENWIPTKSYFTVDGVEYVVTRRERDPEGAGRYLVRRKRRPRLVVSRILSRAELSKLAPDGRMLVSGAEYTVVAAEPVPGEDEKVRVTLKLAAEPVMELEVSTRHLTESRRSANEFTYQPPDGGPGSSFTVVLVKRVEPITYRVWGTATTPRRVSGVFTDLDIRRDKIIELTRPVITEYVTVDGVEYRVTRKTRVPGSVGRYRLRPADPADREYFTTVETTSDDPRLGMSRETPNQWTYRYQEMYEPVRVRIAEVLKPARYRIRPAEPARRGELPEKVVLSDDTNLFLSEVVPAQWLYRYEEGQAPVPVEIAEVIEPGRVRIVPGEGEKRAPFQERVVGTDDPRLVLSEAYPERWIYQTQREPKELEPVDVDVVEVIQPARVPKIEAHRIPETDLRVRPALQWKNFTRAIVVGGNFGRAYINSLFVAVIIVTGQVFTSSLAAYAFSRLRFPFRDTLFLGYLATMMIPGAVTMIPVFIILKNLPVICNALFSTKWFSYSLYFVWREYQSYVGKPIGLDSYFAIIVPGLFSAYGTFMLRQFFMSLPRDLEDAARIDGCGTWGIYTNVILPLSKPALAALTIFTFLGAWRGFMWPLIVTNNPKMETLPVMLQSFMGVTGTQWNLLMAGTLLFLGPMIVVFVCGQRFFVEGIQLGAVKG